MLRNRGCGGPTTWNCNTLDCLEHETLASRLPAGGRPYTVRDNSAWQPRVYLGQRALAGGTEGRRSGAIPSRLALHCCALCGPLVATQDYCVPDKTLFILHSCFIAFLLYYHHFALLPCRLAATRHFFPLPPGHVLGGVAIFAAAACASCNSATGSWLNNGILRPLACNGACFAL